MTGRCARKACKESTGHISGYCSDVCLQLDQDFDGPPVTVGGFTTGLAWRERQPVILPRSA